MNHVDAIDAAIADLERKLDALRNARAVFAEEPVRTCAPAVTTERPAGKASAPRQGGADTLRSRILRSLMSGPQTGAQLATAIGKKDDIIYVEIGKMRHLVAKQSPERGSPYLLTPEGEAMARSLPSPSSNGD